MSKTRRPRTLPAAALFCSLALTALQGRELQVRAQQAPPLPNPILFVTQVPIPADFATIGSVFANHLAEMETAGRGGDLMLLYPDGTLRNLTAEAGFGVAAVNPGPVFQGEDAIAVRDPAVHWNGTKAVFSMVIGAPAEQFVYEDFRWQLYEVSGLGQGETARITRVPRQPADYNNVQPVYASDDRILFISDRPRDGEPHLYPQLDEYETTPTNTGLWSLDPRSGDLYLLDHAPSGDFTPIVDSFGRVLFTRWDHLQRDQQADADALDGDVYGTFDFADEGAGAARTTNRVEVFPEPRASRDDLLAGTNLEGHRFNHFFPWQMRQDGSGLEVLNHLGRHELHFYFNRSLNDDPNLEEFIDSISGRVNPNSVENLLQLREDPTQPGRYVAVDAPEFETHAAGMVVHLDAPPSRNPDAVTLTYLTHPDTGDYVDDGEVPSTNHSGFYRDPLPLSDGSLLAVHTSETRAAGNDGTRANPVPRYHFRLTRLVAASNGYQEAGLPLTDGISRHLSYWDPDVLVNYSGDLWELNPVEVVARPRPAVRSSARAIPHLEAPERAAFEAAGVDPLAVAEDLRQRGLALISVRDVTRRDDADEQQPYNLRVPGGVQTLGSGGKIYDVAHLQFFQGDQVRGIGGVDDPEPGRRVLARHMHIAAGGNPANPAGPQASVHVAADGSAAALVPARRAVSWQLTAPDGEPVVRERYWLTFQPGEIRGCDGCHGVNDKAQDGNGPATNTPQALIEFLEFWAAGQGTR